MKRTPGDIEANLQSMIASKRLQRTESYVRRGRQFGGETLDALKVGWVKSFRRWAEGLDSISLQENLDREAELDLRGKIAPYDQVTGEMDLIDCELRAVIDEVCKCPKQWAELRRCISDEYEAYVENAASPKAKMN